MIGRLTGLRGQVSSHWLAGTFAAAYLVASIVLGIALLNAPLEQTARTTPAASTPSYRYDPVPEGDPSDVPPGPTDDSAGAPGPTGSADPAPTTVLTPADPVAPSGFQRVTGPGGLSTVIPAGWRSSRSSGPGAVQASDPGDTTRYVKFGGAPAPAIGIDDSHVKYENGYAARTEGYHRIVLSSARYGGHDAVEWEFEHHAGGAATHVRSLYWRSGGQEYFLLAAAPVAQWALMRPIYDAMVANAEP